MEENAVMTQARDDKSLKTQSCRCKLYGEAESSGLLIKQVWAMREGGRDPRRTLRFLGWALRLHCHVQKKGTHNMRSQTCRETSLGPLDEGVWEAGIDGYLRRRSDGSLPLPHSFSFHLSLKINK